MNTIEVAHGLPLGILWAIAIRESSGGVHACGYNAWGYASCTGYNFSSWEESIETVATRFAYWVERRGNVKDALCTWQSGQVCSVDGEWYANEVLAIQIRGK